MLYSFFRVIPRRLNFMCRRFGTLCSIFKSCVHTTHEDGAECSETSVYKIQTPRNQPKEKIQPSVCTATQQFIEQLSDCQPLKKNAATEVPSRQPVIPPVGCWLLLVTQRVFVRG